ncbi:MAG TPA: hypothetical protein PLV42_02185 [bacterium]|nr:hypothetical protein [bacterium]
MNTNFQVRKVTGYDPGYPVGRRRPGRLEARPLKFLFLVVGFLFFFSGFGCTNKVETTGVQVADDDSIAVDTTDQPDTNQPDYSDLQGVTDPDFPIDDAAVPDADDELGGEPIPDVPLPDDTLMSDYDEQLGGAPIPDEVIVPDYDDILTGDAVPDVELPDVDEVLAGDPIPTMSLPKRR